MLFPSSLSPSSRYHRHHQRRQSPSATTKSRPKFTFRGSLPPPRPVESPPTPGEHEPLQREQEPQERQQHLLSQDDPVLRRLPPLKPSSSLSSSSSSGNIGHSESTMRFVSLSSSSSSSSSLLSSLPTPQPLLLLSAASASVPGTRKLRKRPLSSSSAAVEKEEEVGDKSTESSIVTARTRRISSRRMDNIKEICNDSSSCFIQEEEEKETEIPSPPENPPQSPEKKRKGRNPKKISMASSIMPSIPPPPESPPQSPEKKRRGRPPKKSVASASAMIAVKSNDEMISSSPCIQKEEKESIPTPPESPPQSPEKKRRGRPPKIKSVASVSAIVSVRSNNEAISSTPISLIQEEEEKKILPHETLHQSPEQKRRDRAPEKESVTASITVRMDNEIICSTPIPCNQEEEKEKIPTPPEIPPQSPEKKRRGRQPKLKSVESSMIITARSNDEMTSIYPIIQEGDKEKIPPAPETPPQSPEKKRRSSMIITARSNDAKHHPSTKDDKKSSSIQPSEISQSQPSPEKKGKRGRSPKKKVHMVASSITARMDNGLSYKPCIQEEIDSFTPPENKRKRGRPPKKIKQANLNSSNDGTTFVQSKRKRTFNQITYDQQQKQGLAKFRVVWEGGCLESMGCDDSDGGRFEAYQEFGPWYETGRGPPPSSTRSLYSTYPFMFRPALTNLAAAYHELVAKDMCVPARLNTSDPDALRRSIDKKIESLSAYDEYAAHDNDDHTLEIKDDERECKRNLQYLKRQEELEKFCRRKEDIEYEEHEARERYQNQFKRITKKTKAIQDANGSVDCASIPIVFDSVSSICDDELSDEKEKATATTIPPDVSVSHVPMPRWRRIIEPLPFQVMEDTSKAVHNHKMRVSILKLREMRSTIPVLSTFTTRRSETTTMRDSI